VKVRARNLGDEDVADIIAILDGWSGALSWERLIEAIEARKFARYTRQALHKHARIARAFAARKTALAEAGPAPTVESPELKVALERIARLDGENSRLRAENALLVEQFVRWAYNAHARGLSKEFLNRPLPSVNRERSRKTDVGRGDEGSRPLIERNPPKRA
jgi:hypothetical protein